MSLSTASNVMAEQARHEGGEREIDLGSLQLEGHARAALETASALTGGGPITAGDLLRAVLVVSDRGADSKGFSYLTSLLPLKVSPPTSAATGSVVLAPELVRQYEVAGTFFSSDKPIWGRDVVTLALLADYDPSLPEVAAEAGASVDELQDRWFEFVTSDDRHRPADQWHKWWLGAGVPAPRERGESGAHSYLLVWHPDLYDADIHSSVEELEKSGTVLMPWSTGSRRHLFPGDRVFLMRPWGEPPGFVGAGTVEGEVEEAPHGDKDERAEGHGSWVVPVRWERLSDTAPVVTLYDLIRDTGEVRLWETRTGGVKIEPDLAATLEDLVSGAAGTPAAADALRFARALSDLDHSLDWIGIRSDVEALSSLIAVNRIEPPLSIAIFGDWGAGKTFLMRKIQERVQLLEQVGAAQEQAGVDDDKPRFCSSILQIEYNAWHYIESNLWASLVNHFFEKLNQKLAPAEKGPDQADLVQKLFEKLETAKAAREAAEQQIQLVTAEVNQAQTAVTNATTDADTARGKLKAAARRNVWDYLDEQLKEGGDQHQKLEEALHHFGYGEALESAQSIYDILTRFRSVSGRAREVFGSMLATRAGVTGAILVAVAVMAATVVAIRFDWPILSVGTVLAGTLGWVAERAGRARKWLDGIQAADSWYSALKQRGESEIAGEVEEARAAYEARKDAVVAARRQLVEAQTREARAKADLTKLTVQDQMRRFVEERVTAQTYAKHLGLISMIRRDFEFLSDYMLLQAQPGETRLVKQVEAEVQQAIPKVERIILYIDDLDRCQPERVVEVLEAVHLLLGFRLFIVVVAVDPRWVLESLRIRYPHLTDRPAQSDGEERSDGRGPPGVVNRGEATAHDYLEKIFHIPFWVKPMGPRACENLIAGFLGFPEQAEDDEALHRIASDAERFDEIRPRNSARRSAITEAPPIEALEQPVDPSKLAAEPTDEEAAAQARRRASLARQARERAAAEREIEQIEITPDEQEFIRKLAPHLGHSPRRIKRYANTYRLLKSGLTRQEARLFGGGDGGDDDYKIVLVFLAVVTGAPTLAPEIFAKAFELRKSLTVQKLIKEAGVQDPAADAYEAGNAEGALELLGRTKIATDKIETWVPRVMRYAFRLAPVDVTEVGE